MTVEQRIVRLERQNRWMKCAGVVLVGLLLIGQSKPQDEVKARRFSLVDEAGKLRGTWVVARGEPHLSMIAGEGGIIGLGGNAGGVGLVLESKAGIAGIEVRSKKGTVFMASTHLIGPGIEIADSANEILFKAP